MLSKFKNLFANPIVKDSPETQQEKLQQACAALLIEVTLADQHQSKEELEKVQKLLHKLFDLNASELKELMQYAEERAIHQTSVHPFTTMVNDKFDYPKKVELIQLMWKVAFADGNLDKYEDSIIRKIADLLYVSHRDFIQAKLNEQNDSTLTDK